MNFMRIHNAISVLIQIFLGVVFISTVLFILVNLDNNTFINLETDGISVFIIKLGLLLMLFNFSINYIFKPIERRRESNVRD
jgi:hypothetical protein